jgi:hypothetical protein
MPRLAPLIISLLVLALPASAPAKGGGGGGGGGDNRQEIRVGGSCGKGATAKLRLRSRDGAIRVQFEVEHTRSRVTWRVSIVQERRVAWRGRARTRAGGLEVEYGLNDLPGADRVNVRAVAPHGLTCVAAATLSG